MPESDHYLAERVSELLGPEGLAGLVLLTDFDGTIARIVPNYLDTTAIPEAVTALEALKSHILRLVIVSGRPLSFLVDHVPATIDLVGLYGLEQRVGATLGEHPEAGPWRSVIAEVISQLVDEAPSGAIVEGKDLSLTIHYREIAHAEHEVLALADRIATETGLHARSAKMSVELHPPIDIDKGTAVVEAIKGASSAVYLGDDIGDLPAFAALSDARSSGMRTMNVLADSHESPAELAAAADMVVDGPDGVLLFLNELLSRR